MPEVASAGAARPIARSAVGTVQVPMAVVALKRAGDVLWAAVLMIVLLPVLLLIAGAVKLTSPGPLLFGHGRIGRDGRTFTCWKFRTMAEDAEEQLLALLQDPVLRAEFAENHKLREDPRVTPLGQFLRRSSLDELPQLWNVLRGQMSLVGPRPIVQEELDRYGAAAGHYLAVRPGMTGPWQVNGRSETTFEERVEMDRAYVEDLSVREDVGCLLRTVAAVARRVGAH